MKAGYSDKSQAQFEIRIKELLDAAKRLKLRQDAGWGYRRTWVKPTTVRKHTRKGHFALLPVKSK